jgi:hypothetical protein
VDGVKASGEARASGSYRWRKSDQGQDATTWTPPVRIRVSTAEVAVPMIANRFISYPLAWTTGEWYSYA